MIVVVNLHRPGIDVRLERLVGVAERRQDERLGLWQRPAAPPHAGPAGGGGRGLVEIGGVVELRPSAGVAAGAAIHLSRSAGDYVSRGAVKLMAALDHFRFPVTGVTALDVGASTGGFTQALLERGAARVYAV